MHIHCHEMDGKPRTASLSMGKNTSFVLWALQDDALGMRSTIIRFPGDHPPPGSLLLAELDIRQKRPKDPFLFRVLELAGNVELEWLRDEGRSRVVKTAEIPDGVRLEATLPDLRRVVFSLDLEVPAQQGAGALVGGSKNTDGPAATATPSLWMVPAAVSVLSEPVAAAKGYVFSRLSKMGLSPALLSPTLISVFFMAGAGFFSYVSYQGASEAEKKMAEAQAERDGALAGRDAALLNESTCIEERNTISNKLNDVIEARKLQAEVALSSSLSQSLAVEIAGPIMATEKVMAYDAIAFQNTRDAVVVMIGKQKSAKGLPDRCLSQEASLGQDLPQYMLLWNPDPLFVCPDQFQAIDGIVDMAGPWGLGARVALEFGAPVEAGDDPRFNHRWSSHALSAALRQITNTLLAFEPENERPAVSPSQVNLWSLALFDGYNRLPAAADEASATSASTCVNQALEQVAKLRAPAEPGSPILPDISLVALGEPLPLTPSAGCPWAPDALNTGALRSLEAVTRMASIEES